MTERCKLKPGAMILHLRAHKIIPQKWIISFKCQSIGNSITSSTRYHIPYSDLISQFVDQNTDFFAQK